MASPSPIKNFIVVGLGNLPHPRTKHSVGHYIVDSIAARNHLGEWSTTSGATSWVVKGRVKPDHARVPSGSEINLTLVKPKPLMNILGPSLRPFMKALPPNSPDTAYFIIYDHLDKDEGYIQVRKGGSANGHNGMRSCLHTLGEHKENVWQVRVGIGRPANASAVSKYVLSSMTAWHRDTLDPDGPGLSEVWNKMIEAVYPKPPPKPKQKKPKVVAPLPSPPDSIDGQVPKMEADASKSDT